MDGSLRTKLDDEAEARQEALPVREVVVQMKFRFKDSRMLPLNDMLDYIAYRLNLTAGNTALVELTDVTVLTDTGIVEG